MQFQSAEIVRVDTPPVGDWEARIAKKLLALNSPAHNPAIGGIFRQEVESLLPLGTKSKDMKFCILFFLCY